MNATHVIFFGDGGQEIDGKFPPLTAFALKSAVDDTGISCTITVLSYHI